MAINHLELFTLASNAPPQPLSASAVLPLFRDSVGFLRDQLPAVRCIKEGPRRGSLMFVHKQEAEEEDWGKSSSGPPVRRIPTTDIRER